MINAAVERKKAALKEVLGKRKVKWCIYQNKMEENEQFGRKMNQELSGNGNLLWKEVR